MADPGRGGPEGVPKKLYPTNAQASPRTAPHPLATKVARSLTSTGAGCGGRGTWYAENLFSHGEKVVAARPDEGLQLY